VRHVTKEDIDDNGCKWSSVQLQPAHHTRVPRAMERMVSAQLSQCSDQEIVRVGALACIEVLFMA
jgi:hypothetical protein